jgi:DNA polymerase III alpha subunit
MSGSRYTELQVTTHFSFLRGASSCEKLFATAAVMGVEALAVVDRNSLAGVVRAHEAAKTTGVRLVVGCRLDLTEGYSVLVYPTALRERIRGSVHQRHTHTDWVMRCTPRKVLRAAEQEPVVLPPAKAQRAA